MATEARVATKVPVQRVSKHHEAAACATHVRKETRLSRYATCWRAQNSHKPPLMGACHQEWLTETRLSDDDENEARTRYCARYQSDASDLRSDCSYLFGVGSEPGVWGTNR